MAFFEKERSKETPVRATTPMPHEVYSTPSIARLGSTLKTPHIQRCCTKRHDNDDSNLEHMVVKFEEDNISVFTTELLGRGGFGKVFSAQSNGGELYALKVSSKKMSESDWKRLNEEVTLMSHFSKHPNIVKFYAVGQDRDRAYVLMERCASRSLHDLIAFSSLSFDEILWIGGALVDTVAYIHSKGCIHRDLKPQNLLFDFNGNLKITDFGLSSRMSETQPRKTVAGTAMYMAPEMAEEVYKRLTRKELSRSLSYGDEVDTWSIGVVFYVLLTRMNPYLDALEKEGVKQLDKVQKSLVLYNAVADAAWSWPKDWSGEKRLCRLVEKILVRHRGHRLTLEEVCRDPIWNERPLVCPPSLLQKLDLLENPVINLRRDSRNENVFFHGRKTAAAVIAEGLLKVEAMETRHRAQLQIEYQEMFNVLFNLLALSRVETNQRLSILQSEEVQRGRLCNQCLSRREASARAGSISLLSKAATCRPAAVRTARSVRSSVGHPVDVTNHGEIVRASTDQYAVVYPGRDTSTRWSLRPVVSLPRDLNSTIEQEFRCLNKHVMTKFTAMPRGYNGFDCNICNGAILNVTVDNPVFRCYKCDYDVCVNCTCSGRYKDVSFVCVSCAKKFVSVGKLHAHSLTCLGPSLSPSPSRASRMNTLLWDEPQRPSLLEVQLPEEDTEPSPKPDHHSGRMTYARTSTGGRISIGGKEVPTPEDMVTLVVKHRNAEFPKLSGRRSLHSARSSTRKGSRLRNSSSSNESFSLELPQQIPISRRDNPTRVRARSSAELRELILEVEKEQPQLKRRHIDHDPATPAAPTMYNENGDIVGIVARRRAESLGIATAGEGVITIRADAADKPREVFRQPKVPPSESSSRVHNGGQKAQPPPQPLSPKRDTRSATGAPPTLSNLNVPREGCLPNVEGNRGNHSTPQVPMVRATSVSGHTPQGGPPLPRRGPAAPRNTPPRPFNTAMAVPPNSSNAIKQSRYSLSNPVQALTPISQNAITAAHGSVAGSGVQKGGFSSLSNSAGGAFLALPQKEQHRQQMVEDFLGGGWVRFYSYTQEDAVVMYYCLQPGRYGAMFPTEAGVGTAVLDIFSKLILYVPCMNNESTNRSQPHPHVQTFYDEEVRILSLQEAQRYLGGVLRCITGFLDEIARLRAEGLTPAAVHAAYIHNRNMEAVPRDTKFVYIRKVFPDPSGFFTLFRLSNLRSQVVCNAMMDIRWQSDRRHHVGQKYYVYADGTTAPFVVDDTGVLSQVEAVLNNNYRR